MIAALRTWWARCSPFVLERDLVQGPIQPRRVAAKLIGEVLLIVLVCMIWGTWWGTF